MERCLQLASNGLGFTYPNPLVGSVVVHNNTIIGEGWHRKAGGPHAEVHAINAVADKSLLSESTIYVNLEPCSHHGRTPPCADLIIEYGIKKVVIGTKDPNPTVSGKGIAKLEEVGIEVIVGVLIEQCNWLNRRFFNTQNKKRPYVILKWAQSQDGFLSPEERSEKRPYWITSEPAQQWTHRLRAQEQAILVGTKTAIDDNPSLNTRHWEGKNPLRVVLDRNLSLSDELALFDRSTPTLVISEHTAVDTENLWHAHASFKENLPKKILEILYQKDIQSVIVEGGGQTLQSFIDAGLWDEAFVLQGPTEFHSGLAAPIIDGQELASYKLGPDLITHLKPLANAGITV